MDGPGLRRRAPSDVFRERVITCFLDDTVTADVAKRAGTELMTWECDYPHSDSDWPESPEAVIRALSELDDNTINQLTYGNSTRLFQFDPFTHRSRETSTVGALRAEAAAAGIDTSPRSMRSRPQTMGSVAGAQQSLLTPSRDS